MFIYEYLTVSGGGVGYFRAHIGEPTQRVTCGMAIRKRKRVSPALVATWTRRDITFCPLCWKLVEPYPISTKRTLRHATKALQA